jgi:hypothetical protein
MKNVIKVFFATLLLLSMTACFDITEEVTVSKDGSGSYSQTMDASQLAEQLKMFAAMDTTGEMIPKMKWGIDSALREGWNKFATVKGVSKLTIDTSKEFVYKVSFDFKDMAALNGALNLDKKDEKDKNAYSWEKGKISRKDVSFNLNDLGMDGAGEQKDMMKTMLTDVKYTMIFNLPNAVKNVMNKEASLSDDKKKVTHKVSMLDLVDGKVKLGNEISYKK